MHRLSCHESWLFFISTTCPYPAAHPPIHVSVLSPPCPPIHLHPFILLLPSLLPSFLSPSLSLPPIYPPFHQSTSSPFFLPFITSLPAFPPFLPTHLCLHPLPTYHLTRRFTLDRKLQMQLIQSPISLIKTSPLGSPLVVFNAPSPFSPQLSFFTFSAQFLSSLSSL